MVETGLLVAVVTASMCWMEGEEFSIVRFRGDKSAADKVYEGLEARKLYHFSQVTELIENILF